MFSFFSGREALIYSSNVHALSGEESWGGGLTGGWRPNYLQERGHCTLELPKKIRLLLVNYFPRSHQCMSVHGALMQVPCMSDVCP